MNKMHLGSTLSVMELLRWPHDTSRLSTCPSIRTTKGHLTLSCAEDHWGQPAATVPGHSQKAPGNWKTASQLPQGDLSEGFCKPWKWPRTWRLWPWLWAQKGGLSSVLRVPASQSTVSDQVSSHSTRPS